MAVSKVHTTAEAEKMKIRAEMYRDPLDAIVAKQTAQEFMILPEKPPVGTGGELEPIGKEAEELPGVVDTVRNPNATTQRASLDRINLAEKAGVFDAAFDMAETVQAGNSIEKSIAHQMAGAHHHAMSLLADAARQKFPADKARLAMAAAKLMGAFQGGALALKKLREGGKQQVTVLHQYVQVAADNVAVAGVMGKGSTNDRK